MGRTQPNCRHISEVRRGRRCLREVVRNRRCSTPAVARHNTLSRKRASCRRSARVVAHERHIAKLSDEARYTGHTESIRSSGKRQLRSSAAQKTHKISSAGCYPLTVKDLHSNLAIRARPSGAPGELARWGGLVVPQRLQNTSGFSP
jgi:hypothetical protein